MSIIKEYLSQWDELSKRTGGFTPPLSYQILQRIGESFTDVKLAKRLGTMKECYSNSFGAVTRSSTKAGEERIYCEGMCVPSGIALPIMHGWTCDTQGENVIEHTLREPAVEYLGVPMQMRFVAKYICTTGYYGVFDNIFLAAKDDDLMAQLQDGTMRQSLA